MNKSIQERKRNSVSILLLLWLLFIPFTLSAQENDKYIMLKPLSWDELQLYQLDNLKTSEELKLAQKCPSTLNKIQKEFTKKRTVLHYIYGNSYIWTEYINQFGNTCIVKHKEVDSIIKKDNKKINPNQYEILSLTQARVLLSSSRGGGNSDKELARKQRIAEVNRINQTIQAAPYEKYGGIENLFNYMAKNKPNCITQNLRLVARTYVTEYGSHGVRLNSPIENFENRYCESQINDLIESVKKKGLVKEPISSIESSMQTVPNFKIYDSNFSPAYPYGGVGRNIALWPAGNQTQGSDFSISPYVSLTAAHVVSTLDVIGNEQGSSRLTH